MNKRGIIHVHSSYSFDSLLSYRRIVKYGKKNNLDFIAITDHDSIIGAIKAKRYAKTRYPDKDLEIIVGIECSTDMGDIIGLYVEENIASRDAGKVIKEIKRQGGIVVIPHPFKDHNLNDELLEQVDLIETFNSRCERRQNRMAEELADRLCKKAIAGCDAHFYGELGNAVCSFFTAEAQELKEMILQGSRESTGIQARRKHEVFSQLIRAIKQRRIDAFVSAMRKTGYLNRLRMSRLVRRIT